MKKIKLNQGSDEWLNWRKTLLTATEAPILMGISPYCTPYKGWLRKTGQAEEQKINSAMIRGQEDEPIARELFIEEMGIVINPCCIESEQYNFLGASLDGISSCGKYIVEIKSNSEKIHNEVRENRIPDYHMDQMQHQLLCTDETIDICFYVSYNNGEIIIKSVLPDYAWRESYIIKAKQYWSDVTFLNPPALTPKDYVNKGGHRWDSLSYEAISIDKEIKELEKRKEEIKEKLIAETDGENCQGSGIKLFRKNVRGRVDYEAIPEIKGIDLDKYRKPSTSTWTILIEKDN